jgi:hypothetical protein
MTLEARQRTAHLLCDLDASVQTKFWASIQLHGIEFSELVRSGKPQETIAKSHLDHAISLKKLTSDAPTPFKFYSLVDMKAAELELLTYEDFRLALLQSAHLRHGGNSTLALDIYARRAWLAKAINKKYNQCVRIARYASSSDDAWLVGRALMGVIRALSVYTVTLQVGGQAELAAGYAKSALQICKVSASLCASNDDDNGMAMVVMGALLTVGSEETETYKWAEQTVQLITSEKIRESAIESVHNQTVRWKGANVAGDIQGDAAWQAMQNMATEQGVDLSDESSPFVKALRIGVKDDTFDRVLVECEHLIVSYGGIGPNAMLINQLFNMKTACSKVINCKLHNFHVEGRDLDSAYSVFRSAYCANCPDQKPRPMGWKFDWCSDSRRCRVPHNVVRHCFRYANR